MDFVCLHESSRPCIANLRTVMRNFDSELPLFQLTFLTMTAHCSSTSSVSFQASKRLQNRLPSDSDRLHCPPSWMNLCTVRVTWRVRSTSETALLFNPLKFAEFHNQSPLLTMVKCNWNSPSREMICGHVHKQNFKYPYPRDSKIIQMPYPMPKQSIKPPPYALPPHPSRLDVDKCVISMLFALKVGWNAWKIRHKQTCLFSSLF